MQGSETETPKTQLYTNIRYYSPLIVFPMMDCRHFLLRHSKISRFTQVECKFSNIPTSAQLSVGCIALLVLVFTFRHRVVLQRHLLFIAHFNFSIFLHVPTLENVDILRAELTFKLAA